MKLGLALLGALIVAGAATPARADEQALSVGVGYATFSTTGEAMGNMAPPTLSPTLGGALGGSYERVIGTDVSLRAELAAGVFYGGAQGDQGNASYAALGDAGVTFRFDVLKVVPYAFAGIGAMVSGGGPLDGGLDGVLAIGGGVDWLRSRTRSYGLELRLASFAGDVTVFTASVRATHRWGFF